MIISWYRSLYGRRRGFLAGVFLLALTLGVPLAAQEARWEELNAQVEEFYLRGEYARSIAVEQQAVQVAEATFGPEHPNVAGSLNNLALLYKAQGKYPEAEPLYRRALGIREKALGPVHPDVATVMENLAVLLRKTGRVAEAEKMAARAEAIRAAHAKMNPRARE